MVVRTGSRSTPGWNPPLGPCRPRAAGPAAPPGSPREATRLPRPIARRQACHLRSRRTNMPGRCGDRFLGRPTACKPLVHRAPADHTLRKTTQLPSRVRAAESLIPSPSPLPRQLQLVDPPGQRRRTDLHSLGNRLLRAGWFRPQLPQEPFPAGVQDLRRPTSTRPRCCGLLDSGSKPGVSSRGMTEPCRTALDSPCRRTDRHALLHQFRRLGKTSVRNLGPLSLRGRRRTGNPGLHSTLHLPERRLLRPIPLQRLLGHPGQSEGLLDASAGPGKRCEIVTHPGCALRRHIQPVQGGPQLSVMGCDSGKGRRAHTRDAGSFFDAGALVQRIQEVGSLLLADASVAAGLLVVRHAAAHATTPGTPTRGGTTTRLRRHTCRFHSILSCCDVTLRPITPRPRRRRRRCERQSGRRPGRASAPHGRPGGCPDLLRGRHVA